MTDLMALKKGEHLIIDVPKVESVSDLLSELHACGLKVSLFSAPEKVDVRAIRNDLKLSQAKFAASYSLDKRTLENWEQGRATPDAAARAYLWLIHADPEGVHSLLLKAMMDEAEDA